MRWLDMFLMASLLYIYRLYVEFMAENTSFTAIELMGAKRCTEYVVVQ